MAVLHLIVFEAPIMKMAAVVVVILGAISNFPKRSATEDRALGKLWRGILKNKLRHRWTADGQCQQHFGARSGLPCMLFLPMTWQDPLFFHHSRLVR